MVSATTRPSRSTAGPLEPDHADADTSRASPPLRRSQHQQQRQQLRLSALRRRYRFPTPTAVAGDPTAVGLPGRLPRRLQDLGGGEAFLPPNRPSVTATGLIGGDCAGEAFGAPARRRSRAAAAASERLPGEGRAPADRVSPSSIQRRVAGTVAAAAAGFFVLRRDLEDYATLLPVRGPGSVAALARVALAEEAPPQQTERARVAAARGPWYHAAAARPPLL